MTTTNAPTTSRAEGYDSFYKAFDSPLMRELRKEAYGEDIGQHSWVTAEELRTDLSRLALTPSSRLLDAGCGPCGPLTFVLRTVGCYGTGTELSAAALAAGRTRAAALGVDSRLTLLEADLNEAMPFERGAFDAVMSLDVILHLRDRTQFFGEVARVLAPKGRFLFTDAGVITGSISNQEVMLRSAHGYTQFVAPGYNERALELAGFRLIETEDRIESVEKNATGRLTARLARKAAFEQLEGVAGFARQQRYLETVIGLSRRRALSRTMYLAERAGTPG